MPVLSVSSWCMAEIMVKIKMHYGFSRAERGSKHSDNVGLSMGYIGGGLHIGAYGFIRTATVLV